MNTGSQKATVITNRLGVSGTGTMYVGIRFQVGDNESIPAYIYITDKTIKRAARELASLGIDLDRQDLQEFEDKPNLLTGREVEIDIQEEEYNGKTSLKVVRIGPESAKPTKEQIERYGKKLKAVAKEIEKEQADSIPF